MISRFFVSEIGPGFKPGISLAKGMFFIVNEKEVLFSYKAISGGWGKPIGPGFFRFTAFSDSSAIARIANKEAYSQFGIGWFALIEDKDGRTQMGAHPDGNVPGSAGCIVFDFASERDNIVAHNIFRDALSDGRKLPLTVFYNLEPKRG